MTLPRTFTGPLAGLLVGLAAAGAVAAQDGDPVKPPKPAKPVAIDADLPKERQILRESSSDPRNMKPDAFPVIRKPRYLEVLKAQKMDPDEWVIGVEVGGAKLAFPVNVLNHHEIVLDEQGGVPFMVCW